ncbi:MAG: hypothetical protein J6573_04715 [Lactobacillus sp.]|nr:hypothetical protein [Lactobacillus sp.]
MQANIEINAKVCGKEDLDDFLSHTKELNEKYHINKINVSYVSDKFQKHSNTKQINLRNFK